MNRLIVLFLFSFLFFGCSEEQNKIPTLVANFKGQQVTGVTVSNEGRVFANFPRWRKGVMYSVLEVDENGSSIPYPSKEWNNWKIGMPMTDSLFIAVQSVVAFDNELYVLDTRNPLFQGVIGAPKIFVFDLTTNELKRTYPLSVGTYHPESYVNDLRVDKKNNKAYFTDSGHAGLIVLDLASGNCKRVLDNHFSTTAEADHLTFGATEWKNTVHSDGIALDLKNDMLYFHSLTGYSLYRIPTNSLINKTNEEIEADVEFVMKTPAPDGMIIDEKGQLYLADLEHDKIMKINLKNHAMSTFVKGNQVKWADTFSIYNKHLYYTNSRINEAGEDVEEIEFSIYKVAL
ncbi:SMP-30/gluconolactonase/LRE family protein [Flammeovirga yaeyamensis]|uniref:SMP-30/gluconolactonase/LRE family protein n=1 Tax=Flammeovirga yaeyamensis TaxID=367791 RepID=A0AAX1NB84_9BACT|nr:L-dopachrome tautomerase-related protein [Flammeovirga yaeyamensis]MBB3697252.1 sugar lactone lactonase YvrE [Flammeovirga yaeyamensis]NMF33910.1 hypothetical protein [Flammeovirga yaeyamensis]QWG04830.1 SMP-30/gluconolactonase/LRE family protein [Flammeovirga yaeyamensis]